MLANRRDQWRLTVRRGSDVEHAEIENLDEAVATMRRAGAGDQGRGLGEAGLGAEGLRARGPGPCAAPARRARAAAEAGRRGRPRGDGTFVPYQRRDRPRGARPDRLRHPVRRRPRGTAQQANEQTDDRGPERQLRRRAEGQASRPAPKPPFTVFVNGIEQREGADYNVARRRDRLHPPADQGEGRHRALAGDVPGPVRHLPQERDRRPPVHRGGKVELAPTCRSIPYAEGEGP